MGEDQQSGSSISEELNKLGQQVSDALRLAWESEDRKRLQTELTDGLRKFGEQVDDAVQQARTSEQGKQIGEQISEQAQRVAEKVQETHVVDDVRAGLVTGLASINRELSRLLDRLAEHTKPPSGPSDPSM